MFIILNALKDVNVAHVDYPTSARLRPAGFGAAAFALKGSRWFTEP